MMRHLFYSKRFFVLASFMVLGVFINSSYSQFRVSSYRQISSTSPAGTIVAMGMERKPIGYLFCDGSYVSPNTYPDLFEAIGYMYGRSGNNFRLPDLRGRFMRGLANGSTTAPDRNSRSNRGDGRTGDRVGTYQNDQFKRHNHGVNDPGHSHGLKFDNTDGFNGNRLDGNSDRGTNGRRNTERARTGISIRHSGGSETRPKNMYVAYWIKATNNEIISGKLGVGITNPTAKLQVRASGGANPDKNGLYVYNPIHASNQHAIIAARVAGRNAGNPFISFDVHTETGWSAGMNNEDNSFKIANSWKNLNYKTRFTINKEGNATFYKGLQVNEATTLKSALTTKGATTLESTLTTNGMTTLKGVATLESTLNVSGESTFLGSLKGRKDTLSIADHVVMGAKAGADKYLTIYGRARVKEVDISPTGNWADYVFANDYKLRPLTEVKTFIDKNKHLPEIPSAEEVKEKGYSLGDMQVRLLKKVEELTLYLLEMKAENEQLRKEVNQLKKQVK